MSSPTFGRTEPEPDPSSGSRLRVMLLAMGPHAKASLGLFSPLHPRAPRLFPGNPSPQAFLRRPEPNPSAPPPPSISRSAASPPTRSIPGAAQESKEPAGVVCSRSYARHHPFVLTGVGAATAVRPVVSCVIVVARPLVSVP
jgi:hypothetical protein